MSHIDNLYKQYRANPTPLIFDQIWSLTKGMVNPNKYFDATKARTLKDFEQVSREALWKALSSYNPEGGSTLLTWIRMKMSQHLIKEVTRISREMRLYKDSVCLNDEYGDGGELIDNMELNVIDGADLPEGLIEEVIAEARVKLMSHPHILQVFDLKIVWPRISRRMIHVITDISKPTLSKYFIKIKSTCLEVFQQKYYR